MTMPLCRACPDFSCPDFSVMKRSGEVVHVALETGDQPCSSTEHIKEFVTLLRDMASDTGLRAVGIGFDVRTIPPGTTEKSDAICIRLEHSDGEAVDVVLPYRKHGELIQYGQLFAVQGPHHVFQKG